MYSALPVKTLTDRKVSALAWNKSKEQPLLAVALESNCVLVLNDAVRSRAAFTQHTCTAHVPCSLAYLYRPHPCAQQPKKYDRTVLHV